MKTFIRNSIRYSAKSPRGKEILAAEHKEAMAMDYLKGFAVVIALSAVISLWLVALS